MIKVVFAHLGSARAPWVFSNINRQLTLFPKIPILFISDRKWHLQKAAKLGAETFRYHPTRDTDEMFSNTIHDSSFRYDFWRTSVERLIAIQQYQNSANQEKLLHIESDVMLLPNFPWKKIQNLDKLAWLSANAFLDCAALLYSPSIEATNWLVDELNSEIRANNDSTDMKILFSIRKKFPKEIHLFPSTTPDIADQLLKNDEQRFFENTKMTSYFEGIFDVGNMGMWLTGQNPRNQGGRVIRYEKYFTQDNDFNPDSFTLQDNLLSVGENSRENVFNLHVHSKNMRLLSPYWHPELRKLVDESRSQLGKQRFSISGYFGSQYDIFVSVNRNILIYLVILLKMDRSVSKIRSLIRKLY